MKKVDTSKTIRFVGGGALAPLTCQTIADITGREIETVEFPQNVGAKGAAVVAAVGLGLLDNISDAGKLIKADAIYSPDINNKAVHDRNFKAFKMLYKKNKNIFRAINHLS